MFVKSYDYDASFEKEGDKLARQHLHRDSAIILLNDPEMMERVDELQNTFDNLKKFEILVCRPDTRLLEAGMIAEYGLVVHVGPIQDDGERCVKVYFEGSFLSNFEDFDMTYFSEDRKKKLQTTSSEQGFQLTKVMSCIVKLEEMGGHDALISDLWSLAKDMKKARDAGYVKKLSCNIDKMLPELKQAWEEMSLGTLESFIHDRLIKCKVGHELISTICDTLGLDLKKILVYECNPKCAFYGAGKSIAEMLVKVVTRVKDGEGELIYAKYGPPLQTCVGKKKDRDGVMTDEDADNHCGKMVSAQYAGQDLYLTPEVRGKIKALLERLIQELGEDADKMEVEGECGCGSKRASDDESGEENKRRVVENGNLCVGNRVLSVKAPAADLFFDAMDHPKAEKPTGRTLSFEAEAEPSGRTMPVSGRTLSLAVDAQSLSSPTRSSSHEDEDDCRNNSCAVPPKRDEPPTPPETQPFDYYDY